MHNISATTVNQKVAVCVGIYACNDHEMSMPFFFFKPACFFLVHMYYHFKMTVLTFSYLSFKEKIKCLSSISLHYCL